MSTTALPLDNIAAGAASNSTLLFEVIDSGAIMEADDIGYEYYYVLPIIIIFGVTGNAISLVAILHSRLRRTAANQYLIVLTAADSVFLLALLSIWRKLDYVAYEFCVFIEYILQVASYVSSWSISALTIERYLAIAHPLKHMRYAHVNRYYVMALWVPIPFAVNVLQFFTLVPEADPHQRKCLLQTGSLQAFTELLDLLLCYVIPCLIVVVLNIVVAVKVDAAERGFMQSPSKSDEKHEKHITPPAEIVKMLRTEKQFDAVPVPVPVSTRSKYDKTVVRLPSTISVASNYHRDSRNKKSISNANGRHGSGPSAGSTRILVVVPVVYILLNTPFYMIRLVEAIRTNVLGTAVFVDNFQQEDVSQVLIYFYNAAHYLYYISFACDVIVYAFSSANFRKTVVIAWRQILCPHLDNDYTNKSELQSHMALSRHSQRCSTRRYDTCNTSFRSTRYCPSPQVPPATPGLSPKTSMAPVFAL